MNFRAWYLNEGQMEIQALRILNNDQNSLNQLLPLDTTPTKKHLPLMALFLKQGANLQQIQQYFEKYKQLEEKKRVSPLQIRKDAVYHDNKPVNFLQFTELVDGLYNLQSSKKGKNDGMPLDAKAIMSKNGIDVYEANSPQACVKYGQGYSFCISKPGGTMWQSYRDMQASTFYFVFDRNLDKDNPLHVVVVDMTENGPSLTDANNSTGNIAQFGSNANAYLQYLEKKGIPSSVFKNIPKSPQEEDESERLGSQEFDLEWFKNLSHDYKSKYIGRGHTLSKKQFRYLWDNKAFDLIHQYITTGRKLADSELDLVATNNQLKRSYLQTRMNAEEWAPINAREYLMMDDAQKAKITNVDDIYTDAARTGNLELLQSIMLKVTDDAHHILNHAAIGGHAHIVQYLLHNLPKNRIHYHDINYALDEAASKGNLDIVKLLVGHVESLGSIQAYSYALQAPLVNAAANGHTEIIKYLMPYIDNTNKALSSLGQAAAADRGIAKAAAHNHIDVVQLLLPYAQNVSGDSYRDISALTYAAANGNMDIMKLLLPKAKHFKDAAISAASSGHIDIVKLLMPKLNASEMNQIFEAAAIKNRVDVAALALPHVTKMDKALHYAVNNNHTEIINMILNDPKAAYIPKSEIKIAWSNAADKNNPELVHQLRDFLDKRINTV